MAEKIDKKIPRIRFQGFGEQWKPVILGDILIERKVLQKISDDAPILAFAAGQGVIPRSERKSNNRDHLTLDQTNKLYKLTEYDDIVYNPSNLKYGAIDRNKYGRGVISPIYVTFITEEKSAFVEHIVKSDRFKLKALMYEEGTVVKRQSVKPENLLSLEICIASLSAEQTQIGTYFTELDRMLELHQRKHDKLLKLKKAMLQKMFPKSGSTTPEIRFRGFEGGWKVRRLGDITLPLANNALSRENLNNKSGLAKNIHYGDILVKFGEVIEANTNGLPFISNPHFIDKLKPSKLQDGDIILADAAEDSAVGKCTELQNVGNTLIFSGLHTIALRPSISFAPAYLGYFMNSNIFHNQLLPLMQGTKVLSVSKTALKETKILYPLDFMEQKKIGSHFLKLNELIALHATQLGKIKQIKSACLEKMFVYATRD